MRRPGMEPCAEQWEALLARAVMKSVNRQLSVDEAHALSVALRKEMVAYIMRHGKLNIPLFGGFEIRRHKGGCTYLPPIAGGQRIDIEPYYRLAFRANQRVRHEIQEYDTV